jgi:choline monooxygenase
MKYIQNSDNNIIHSEKSHNNTQNDIILLERPSVASYFCPEIANTEKAFFKDIGYYIGCQAMVSEDQQYQTLLAENHARTLINDKGQIRLLSNICRHRQAIMLKDRGQSSHIVCPLHRWTYENNGELMAAPHFAEKPCAKLQEYPIQSWQGLLFERGQSLIKELSQSKFASYFNFENYHLGGVKIHECNYNWKTFIEVYLEDYHVAPFHPGLGKFVDCHELDWEFGKNFSVQAVGIHQDLKNPGSAIYRQWHESILKFNDGRIPEYGAIWVAYYPYLMLEWYPHVLIASHLHPISPTKTRNIVEFYYPEEIALFEPELIQAEQKAYAETCIEDDEIAERMDQGRYALYQQNREEHGPYQQPMEAGMQHFHQWYCKMLAKK